VLLPAVLALLLAPALAAPPAVVARQTVGAVAEVPALRRIVVLGASMSHGYGLEKDAGGKITLADVVDASLRSVHEPVRSKTSLLFFADPLPTGKAQAAAGSSEKPTLVVGIDYLFWYGYGLFASDADRMAMLEKGLAELEAFDCPVLVGDFPDVSDAARSPPGAAQPRGGLLAPEQVPTPEMRAKLNGRLRAWAADRKNVVVVPLGELVGRLHAGKDLEIHGNSWPKPTLAEFVQEDRLHPTLEGTIALWLGALDALVAGRDDVPATAFDWDAGSISKRLHAVAESRRGSKASTAAGGKR
jgi:hypothetical protein